MELKVILNCPLGHKCEEAKDGAIHRCAWFLRFQGEHPETKEIKDEMGCAMHWTPTLILENARHVRSGNSTLENLRNIVSGSTPAPESGIPLPSNPEGRFLE